MDAVQGKVESQIAGSISPVMQQVLTTAEQAARSDATVLIVGESGTGKSVLAAYIHRKSRRCNHPFLSITSQAFGESQIFGCTKGALPGVSEDTQGALETARGGTVFFEEVAELPTVARARLRRLTEEREFEPVGSCRPVRIDIRIIASTTHDLEEEARSGRFPHSLFFCLSVIAIRLPPLRERLDDLPLLVDHYLTTLCTTHGREPLQLSAKAREVLATYDWPGNVRELVHVLERAVVMTKGDTIHAPDIRNGLASPVLAASPTDDLTLEGLERQRIQQVLAASDTRRGRSPARHQFEHLVAKAETVRNSMSLDIDG